MPDKPWKKFEREVAGLIGGRRLPSSSDEVVDCEGPTTIAQCKIVSRLSLDELTTLAEVADAHGRTKEKLGVVAVKVKRGAGYPSSGLMVMTFAVWSALTLNCPHGIRTE